MSPSTAPNLLVVDSGIGGLSVVSAIRERLPNARIAYLADNGKFPYGALSDQEMLNRLPPMVARTAAQLKPDAIVLACNTASTVVLPDLRTRVTVPVIGCVPPIKPAAQLSKTRCIGLLATEATVRRPYIENLTSQFAADCTVFSWGSATLAALAEAAFRRDPVDLTALAAELHALLGQPGAEAIDSVVLGCTHYAFLLPEFRQIAPKIQHWLDPADPVARQVASVIATLPRNRMVEWPDIVLTTAKLPAGTENRMRELGFNRFLHLETVAIPA